MEASDLQRNLEEAESKLKSVDSRIKESTGFDPNERRSRVVSRGGTASGANQWPYVADQRQIRSDDFPAAKRRRLSESEGATRIVRRTVSLSSAGSSVEDRARPAPTPVLSSVLSTQQQRPSRPPPQSDAKSVARNRRMFGMLMGTLEKFKSDESSAQAQVQKQKEIEERLEESKKKEREETVKQRETLYRERREQTAAVNSIKTQLELVELKKEWDAHKEKLKGDFILLKACPPIFYRPAEHTTATRKLVEETHRRLEEETAKRHEAIMSAATNAGKAEVDGGDEGRHGRAQQDSTAPPPEDDALTFDATADGVAGLPGVDDSLSGGMDDQLIKTEDADSVPVTGEPVQSVVKSEAADDQAMHSSGDGSRSPP